MLVSTDDKLPLDNSDTLSCTTDADKTCFRAGSFNEGSTDFNFHWSPVFLLFYILVF